MAVVQTALDIPDEIWAELLAGNYVRDGGVVRDLAGRLVKLLDEASPTVDTQEVSKAAVARALADHRYFIFGIGAAAVTAGSLALWINRRRAHHHPQLTAGVQRYNASLTAYLEAARSGNLNAEIVGSLLEEIEVIVEDSDVGDVATAPRPQRLEALVKVVANHTTRLAEANHLEFSDHRQNASDSGYSAITDLRRYLEFQERIFKGAM